MPAPKKVTGRAKKEKEVQREQNLQKLGDPQDATQRPRTRAWTKQEEQRKKEANLTSTASHLRLREPSPRQAPPTRLTRSSVRARPGINPPSLSPPPQAIARPTENKTLQPTDKRKDPKASREKGKQPVSQVPQLTKPAIQDSQLRQPTVLPIPPPVLSTWLEQLQSDSPEDSRALPLLNDRPSVGSLRQFDRSMESSSSASRTSQAPSEGGSTAIPARSRKGERSLSLEKLRLRRILDTRTEDERSEHFRSVLDVKPIEIPFEDIADLKSIVRDFLQQCKRARPSDNSYEAIEDLSNRISQFRPGVNLVSITNREFDIDVKYCRSSNEAVLQRTVMADIIDRWQLPKLFVYNCEGQWSIPSMHILPSRDIKDEVTLPKPDLAISFTLEALTGIDTSSPFPKDLGGCMRPDGGVGRCFPFIFMEAKRGGHDLQPAFMANLHSASQALFNIYIWMLQAGHEEIFFDRVRVFSIVLNAHEISMRVHRALPVAGTGALSYHFDDITSINGYGRDQACLLFKNVLIEYGEMELYGIVKSAFEEVSRQKVESNELAARQLQSKRKAGSATNASTKKARSGQGGAQSSPDTTSSFGASALGIV